MRAQDILEYAAARSFQPFRLHVSDGSTHDVRHPDLVLVELNITLLGVPSATNPELADGHIKIDNRHITKIIPLKPVDQPTNPNGQA